MRLLTKVAIAVAALAAPTFAVADTYQTAHFSGGVFGGNANAKAPFGAAGITQGMTFSGTFLIDTSIVVPGAGFFNELYSTYADAAVIPDNIDFAFNLGSLNFTSAGDAADGIQFKNGHFNGFTYNTVFDFQNVAYNFSLNGGTFSITDVATSSNFVNGYINIGDAKVTDRVAYTPPVVVVGGPGVPEPASWALMITGFGLAGTALRRRRLATTA